MMIFLLLFEIEIKGIVKHEIIKVVKWEIKWLLSIALGFSHYLGKLLTESMTFKIGMVLLMHGVSVNDLNQKLNFRGGGIFQVHQLGGPPDTAAEGGDADAGEL